MVDYIELGFWLLAAFAVILFFQTVLTWRKYKLLKTQYEQMQLDYEGERKALEGLEKEVHSVMSAKSETSSRDNAQKLSEMQQRLENLETAASIEHNKLEQALYNLSSAKAMPNVGEEIIVVKRTAASAKRKASSVEKKLKKSAAQQIILSRKITLLRGVKEQLKVSKRKISELSQEHNRLKREFQKHELVPVHDSTEQVEHLDKFLKVLEGKIREIDEKVETA